MNNRPAIHLITPIVILIILTSCESAGRQDFSVNYEKFTLDNGLEVIFHQDKSDPVVAVALTFHVGSAREKEGKTGFAHLFEHLLFLESENLGPGGLDEMSSRIGGSGANGSTSRDRTNYFQTVPSDALEKMIWAEADKMGFFINTVTEAVLQKEKQVVKNEKRQRVDNAPYGHAGYVTDKHLYPVGHPYSWQVIGSLDDLQAATLDDVKEFYARWYVPNNATLVIAGDFDPDQAREWIHKYFDEIPRGGDITPLEKETAALNETKKLYHEDNFARLPELRLTWPGVEQYHPDSWALQILTTLLSDGKTAPLYKVLVEEKKLTSNVSMFSRNSEIAGEISLLVRAYPGTDLNEAAAAIEEAFRRYENEGFTEKDLQRVKAGIETGFYNGLSSVLGKAFQLAQYNIFAGDPGFVNEDIKNTLNVTLDDINRVYNTYLKGKNYVASSFVPRGHAGLVLEGSEKAEIPVENIAAEGEGEAFTLTESSGYERTPSSFDRTREPPYGADPAIQIPDVWEMSFDNGLSVYGIENNELPIVQFNIRIDGGMMAEEPGKNGAANMLAELMTRGTAGKTPAELEEAINLLGATIRVDAGRQEFRISGNTLARNFDETMKLVEEIIMEPRWDEKELELVRQGVLSRIAQMESNPNSIAADEFNKLLYGNDHILASNPAGTRESVQVITIEDLKAYYKQNLSPEGAFMHIAGAVNSADVMISMGPLATRWKTGSPDLPGFSNPDMPGKSKIYFYNVPNASQSVLRIGYLALSEDHPDYYKANIMNYILGGGGFASRLTQELREGKGYTYGIRSGFSGSHLPGPFSIGSGVRTNVTYESLALIKNILDEYPQSFTTEDLEKTKSFLLKSNARAFETLGSKIGILETMSRHGWDAGYLKQREDQVRSITLDDIRELARKYANPDRMIYLVVGDARTQLDRLTTLGFGDPILLN